MGSGSESSVVLFDGVCRLCHRTVNFVLDRDRQGSVRFAPLQSEPGRSLLERFDLPRDSLGTVVLVEEGRAFTRSTAMLRLMRKLSGAWPLLYAFILVPRPLRDWAYDWFAERRYRWFGKFDACRLPDPEVRDRFLA